MTVPIPVPHPPCSVGILVYHPGTFWLCWGSDSGQPRKGYFGRCPLIQAFCPPHARGMGPFLFVISAACSVVFPPRSAGHSPLSGSGRSDDTSFHWEMCQAAYRLGDFRVPPSASWEGIHCISIVSALQLWGQLHLCPLACLGYQLRT